jgi:hypothetical protein
MASEARGLDREPASRGGQAPTVAWLLFAALLWAAIAVPFAAVGQGEQAEVQPTSTFESGILAAELPILDSLIRRLLSSQPLASAAGALSRAASEVESGYTDWIADVEYRLSTAVSAIPGCAIRSIESDDLAVCNAALKTVKKDYRAATSLINRANRLELLSEGSVPLVIGILLGVSGGVVVLLSLAFAVLRRGEARRFGGVLTSHPLRAVSSKVLFVVSIIVLVISLIVFFAVAQNGRGSSYQQLLSALDDVTEQLRQLERLPEPEPEEAQTPGRTVALLRVRDLPMPEARSQISELEKSVRNREQLASRISRTAREVDEAALVLQKRVAAFDASFASMTPSRVEVESVVGDRIQTARSSFRARTMAVAGVSAAVVGLLLGLLYLLRHRRWDDHKRRGSYGGW